MSLLNTIATAVHLPTSKTAFTKATAARVAGLAVALAAATAAAEPVVYEVAGQLTEAENLAFSVINGTLLNQAPLAGDLPLNYTGTLTLDLAAGTADFAFSGGFTSPTRAYTFDLVTPDILGGLDVYQIGGVVSIIDTFDDFDFDLTLSVNTGFGQFSFRQFGVVPTSPVQDVFARGTITSVTIADTSLAGDWNASGTVDVLDVVDFITDWNAGRVAADVNGDGGLDVLDVVAFITIWNG